MEESGRCEGPICITNTHSCGVVRDASIRWLVERTGEIGQRALPVTGETFDGYLNDINGFHVRDEHAFAALDSARGGAIEEGSVGGGTGMICYGFKGGSGTASRVIEFAGKSYRLGAFVQSNFGRREQLTIAGVPVGAALKDCQPYPRKAEAGSVIAIIGTDAPLLAHQLKRWRGASVSASAAAAPFPVTVRATSSSRSRRRIARHCTTRNGWRRWSSFPIRS